MNKLHLTVARACRSRPLATRTPPTDDADERRRAELERGPNGGRLLADGDFTLELAIFEAGVPPEFHAWATAGRRDRSRRADVDLTVELARLGGGVDRIEFAPQDDFLRGNADRARAALVRRDRRRAPCRPRASLRVRVVRGPHDDRGRRRTRRRHRHGRRRGPARSATSSCSTARSRPTPRACAPCTRASPASSAA